VWEGRGLRGIAALAALGTMLTAQSLLPERVQGETGAVGEELVPRPEIARLASLGFDSLLADYYWLRAVQIVGGERQAMDPHVPALTRLAELTVALDPWVGHPYRFAAVWLNTTPEAVRAANRMLERGIAYHPTDWRNRFYLSFNHFFYLSDSEAAARELEPAVGLAGAPPYLGRLLARLRSEAGGLEVAEAYLLELAKQTEDPDRRRAYELAVVEIEIERRARVLDAARAAYRERNGRDIGRVEDLLQGPDPVLDALPPLADGSQWILDPASNEIVSSLLRRRYLVYVHPADQERRKAWARHEVEAGEDS
jgi:hypothetical protein